MKFSRPMKNPDNSLYRILFLGNLACKVRFLGTKITKGENVMKNNTPAVDSFDLDRYNTVIRLLKEALKSEKKRGAESMFSAQTRFTGGFPTLDRFSKIIHPFSKSIAQGIINNFRALSSEKFVLMVWHGETNSAFDRGFYIVTVSNAVLRVHDAQSFEAYKGEFFPGFFCFETIG